MTTVETVRGPVEATELGPTLAHEHVFVMQPEALQNYGHVWGSSYWDEDVRVAAAVDKLARSPRRRHPRRSSTPPRRASAATSRGSSGSTRRSTSTSSSQPASTRSSSSPTSSTTAAPKRSPTLRPGDPRGDRRHRRESRVPEMRRRGARARRRHPEDPRRRRHGRADETGAPVMVHTNASASTGTIALEALTSGVSIRPGSSIAHAGDSNDLDYLRTIGDTGATLGCDRFNIPHFNPDADRIRDAARAPRGRLRRPHPPLARRRMLHGLHGRATRTSPASARTTSTSLRRSCRRSASTG